jgi:Domain of unknown function (DUF4118)
VAKLPELPRSERLQGIYIYLFPVALIAALYNGRLAVLCAAVAIVCADLFLQEPLYSLANDNPLEYGDLIYFALLAVTAIKFIRVLARPPFAGNLGRRSLISLSGPILFGLALQPAAPFADSKHTEPGSLRTGPAILSDSQVVPEQGRIWDRRHGADDISDALTVSCPSSVTV